MLIKGQPVQNIVVGNTLSEDGHCGARFDYTLSNPPFGVEWKKVEKTVRQEHEHKGFDGRFGPGLPRVSDGSMLFLMHLVAKMRPALEGGFSRDVRSSGRWGTGDVELSLRTVADLERAKPLIERAYHEG